MVRVYGLRFKVGKGSGVVGVGFGYKDPRFEI
jgi:hypothetical protein